MSDVMRVIAKMSVDEGDIINVYHSLVTIGVVGVSDAEIVTGLSNAVDYCYDLIKAFYSEDLDFDTIEVWNVSQDRPMGEVEWPTLTNGTGTGDLAPLQVAPLILFGTDVARSQGRKYLPAPLESVLNTKGTLTSTFQAAMAAFGAALLPTVNVGEWEYGFGNYNYDLADFRKWTTAIVRDVARTQRRRVLGVGS